ncbi:hypothetical protein [Alteromonas stellipolaris]|uniref:Uncharacterized protein n=1 Tax=Alteromonas stellipolaris TaxID=233316 RepID=A0ABM5YQG4_9ALTE|nr:hypothetical protein AVL57_00430 [Alteromonas stellipolaris]
MKIIQVDPGLKLCPICGHELNFGAYNSRIATRCSECDYYEKAGSLHITSFITAALTEYCVAQKILHWDYENTSIPIHEGMVGNHFLPLIVNRANALSVDNNQFTPLSGKEPLFKCVPDKNSWLSERVVVTEHDYDKDALMYSLTLEVVKFTSVITESLDMAKTLSLSDGKLHPKTIIQPEHGSLLQMAPTHVASTPNQNDEELSLG